MPAVPVVERVDAGAYTIPTDSPESDGTFSWDATTLVLVQAKAGDRTGIGYSYTSAAVVDVIAANLAPTVLRRSAFDVPAAWRAMQREVRNLGKPGLAACAISAVDTALWDLKARLLDLPLVDLFGGIRPDVTIYGSSGFTSWDTDRLQREFEAWAGQGLTAVKMKVGRDPHDDAARVEAARAAIGVDVALMVDANGAYDRVQAAALAQRFADSGVSWFEEPVSSDDLAGLADVRDRVPPGMAVAAGEYGYDTVYFRRMLDARAVDVLQADATRCMGFSGFLEAASLCAAHHTPLSTHTAPALHLHVACSAHPVRDVEYFQDHVRVEEMLFDGVVAPEDGRLQPDRTRPGNGLSLRGADAERYRVR